jgi:UDP-N-acetylmuramoyl-L-alanyl-D-glutamate--2,6-diaminopimelate ligase
MQSGLSPVEMKSALRISDRKEAIKTAVAFAKEGDILLIAGKGHEKYQEINGVKHHFDDFEIIKELFETQTL